MPHRRLARSILAVGLAVATVGAGACGGDGAVQTTSAPTGSRLDRPDTFGPGATWHWQLQGDIDTTVDADVYDLDLFDTPPDTIEELHADGRVVICYFSTAYEDWRPDVASWPADSLGRPLDDWEGERWVDVRDPDVLGVLIGRLDLAVERGCDGVEPDNVTAYDTDSGFDLTRDDQLGFLRSLAVAAHERGLLVGLKNALELVPDLVDWFDFAVNEQCVEFDECDAYRPFVEAGTPVFGAEYSQDAIDDPRRTCATAAAAGMSTVIVPIELDGSFRIPC